MKFVPCLSIMPVVACLALCPVVARANTESAINGTAGEARPLEVGQVPSSGEIVSIASPATKIISHQPEYYHGWPTVAVGKDGALHLIYSGGRAYHVCPFGRLDYMVSKDGGETWSWPRTIADSLTDDRDSGVLETKNGVLLASFFTSVAYQKHMNEPERLLTKVFGDRWPDEFKRWQSAELAATQVERKADVGYWLSRSEDGGKTWSARYKAPGYCPHGPVSLADGRVFYAAADGKKAAAWVSADDGLTWTHLADLPTRAGELHSIEAADGTLLVHVRDKVSTDKGTVQRTLQTESRDGGKTWSLARFVTHGYPSHLALLKDKTLLMTYGSRAEPFGIRGKVSRDHGKTWSEEFFITKDAPSWDHGYPSTAQLADGSLVTVWYEAPKDSHLAQLRQAKWRLP
jgi:sialidase-1